MTHTPLRHRHFVAMPLMALLLLGVGGLGAISNAAIPETSFRHDEEILSGDEEKQFSLPESSLSVLLQPQSRVLSSNRKQALRIETGTALIKATGLTSVGFGFGAEATLCIGSMLVVSDASSSTVIALTAPLVVVASGHEWILPPRYQLRIEATGSVQRSRTPLAWFSEQLSKSHSLPVTPLPPPSDAEQLLLRSILSADVPSDTVSMELQSLPDADRLVMLARLLDGSDADIPLQTVNAVFTVSDTLKDLLIQHVIALRLATLAGSMDNETGERITFRIATQSLPPSELVFAVPAIALSILRPLPEGLLDLWAQFAIESAASNTSLTASILHPLLPLLPASYESAGYPKQAILWREAVRRLETVLMPLLSGAERNLFISDIDAALHDLPIRSPSLEHRVSSSASAPPQEHSLQSIAETREFLLQHNVLFTPQTAIVPDERFPDCMRVDGVFLAGEHVDESYAFSLCLGSQRVRRISRDGIPLPNDVPFEKFFR